MADRNVPGHTVFTRTWSLAYSTAATLASWITAAFVAQYGPACDHAVMPATDAVRMIEPDFWARITGTAALMALTAPITLMLSERCQSASVRLWMRPLGASTPALLMSTSRRPKRSTARATTASTCSRLDTSAVTVAGSVLAAGKASSVAASDASLMSLSTTSVSGRATKWADSAEPRVPPAPRMTTTRLSDSEAPGLAASGRLLVGSLVVLIRGDTRRRR